MSAIQMELRKFIPKHVMFYADAKRNWSQFKLRCKKNLLMMICHG
jgi:hypothetical protein